MIEVKTADLIAPALDWAVGEVEGWWLEEPYHLRYSDNRIWCNEHSYGYCPSEDWSQGGPLIEKYEVAIEPFAAGWFAEVAGSGKDQYDDVPPLVVACRAIVAAELGDVVRAPAELVGGAV